MPAENLACEGCLPVFLPATLPKPSIRAPCRRAAAALQRVSCLVQDQSGALGILTAVSLTVLVGAVGLGIDAGMWYRDARRIQNAADSAAIAAAKDGSANYEVTGKAVAAQYGFVDGDDGVTVNILNNQTCPDGLTNCYAANIVEGSAPQFFSNVLGVSPPSLAGSAMAGGGSVHQYCVLALASSGISPAITANGVPKADLTGCSVMSNTNMTCNGHNLNADYGDAHGTNSGCGNTQNSNDPTVTDPYSSLSSQIPPNTCGSYPQEPAKKNDPALPPGTNQWPGNRTLPATTIICGDLQLTGDVTLTTASPGSLLVIENGQLDTNGHTLQTAAGSALTIIFTGTAGSYTHAPTGGGTLNFQAPSSGTWSGIAIYQDPSLTAGINISAAGNSPTWDITGVVYLPHASVTFSGAVNKSSNGASCFLLVIDNLTINGTGSILAHGGCSNAGVTMPTDTVGGSTALVQ